MNLAQLLVRSARLCGRHPALAHGEATTADYAGLAARVGALARGLREGLKLTPGARVALVMRNCPQYVELLFACWHAGLAAVPINAKLHPRELAWIFADAAVGACFVSAEYAEGAARAAADCEPAPVVVDVAAADYAGLAAGTPLVIAERRADDLAWLFYTSGTTGRPKGVMLGHGQLLAMTLNYFADVDAIAPGEAILHAAPMSHGSGLYILPHVARAACNIAPASGGFDAEEVFALLGAHRGVSLFAAPTMVKRLADHAEVSGASPAGLKTLIYGGGPMYVADCKRALAVLGPRLTQIYGQGESPMTISVLPKRLHTDFAHPRYEARLASVGHAFTGIELRVADGAGRSLPPGEAGEVLARGATVMAGYLNRPQPSAETLAGGWLHTGDVGVLDEDGFLTLKDRARDLIISGGSNIYPREVEEVLLTHAGVAEVSVVGEPDAEWGENVVAFVVASAGTAPDTAALDAHCLAHIARFKRPKRYLFVDALPKNPTGKVLKTELRQRLGAPPTS